MSLTTQCRYMRAVSQTDNHIVSRDRVAQWQPETMITWPNALIKPVGTMTYLFVPVLMSVMIPSLSLEFRVYRLSSRPEVVLRRSARRILPRRTLSHNSSTPYMSADVKSYRAWLGPCCWYKNVYGWPLTRRCVVLLSTDQAAAHAWTLYIYIYIYIYGPISKTRPISTDAT